VSRHVILPDGRKLDFDYFIHWRPYLWRIPIAHVLDFLGDLKGRSVLHIGDFPGRLTSLLAMLGANVTMADITPFDDAKQELAKWGVMDRVRLVQTSGGLSELGTERYEVVLTKSVLWAVPNLDWFLDEIDGHLGDGGKVAFVENTYGSPVAKWLRSHFRSKRFRDRESRRFGVKNGHLPLFRQKFSDVTIKTHWWMVYEILGRKRPQA